MMTVDHQTKEYVEHYYDEYFDKIHYVKLSTGELIIGFVFDETYVGKMNVDYPRLLRYNPDHKFFELHLYQPNTVTDTVPLKKVDVVFMTTPEDSIKKFFVSELIGEFDKRVTDHTKIEGNNTIH